jgi:tetratricopeptide (TPR) repeat protein
MRPLRIVAAIVIGAAAFAAIGRVAYQPWRCSVMRRSLEPATLRLWERHDLLVASQARENAAMARACVGITPYDSAQYMLAAANDRLSGNIVTAAAMYETALRFDRRPEIYFDLGLMQLDLARTADAEESFVQAGSFDPYTILEIPPDDVRNRVMQRVGQDHYFAWWGPEQPALKRLRK